MNYCSKCHRIAADNESFCVDCGEPISKTTEVKEEAIVENIQAFPDTEPISYEDDDMGLLKKIALISLSVSIAPIGLVVGLIMMSSTENSKKDFGQIIVIVAVVVFVAITVCCCAFTVLVGLLYSA